MRRVTYLFCLLLTACQASGPLTRGVPVTFDSVCNKTNEGKRVMLVGYVDFPLEFGDSDITIMTRVRPSLASWEGMVGASAKLGNAANNIEMPPQHYKKTDLKLHLADGQVVGYSKKVRVSGTLYYPSSIAKVDFKCALTNSLFEPLNGQ